LLTLSLLRILGFRLRDFLFGFEVVPMLVELLSFISVNVKFADVSSVEFKFMTDELD
jgi:hypothetical protein